MTTGSTTAIPTSTPDTFISTDHAHAAINMMQEWFPDYQENIEGKRTTLVQHLTTLSAPNLGQNQKFYTTYVANKNKAKTATTTTTTTAGITSTTTSTTTPAPNLSNGQTITTSAQDEACLESWLSMFVDFGLFVISLTGLDINNAGPADDDFAPNYSGEMIDGLDKLVKRLSVTYEAFSKDVSFSTVWDLAKAFANLASGIWTLVLKPLIEGVLNSMTWYDWVLEGVSVIGTMLSWFASASLALIGQIVLAIDSGISFVIQLANTLSEYPPAMFAAALKSTNGVFPALNPAIMQNSNPSSALLNGTLYLFFVQQDQSIGCLATTEEQVETLNQDESKLKAQLKEDYTAGNGTGKLVVQKICNATKKYYENASTPVTNNAASPVAITFNNSVYLFYIQNSGPGTNPTGLYCINTTDGKNWSEPWAVTGAESATTPPAVIVCNSNLMVFWRGGGSDMQLYTNQIITDEYGALSWDGVRQMESSMTTNTSPAAWSYAKCYYLFFQSSAGDNTVWFGMQKWGTNNFSNLQQLKEIKNSLTPAVYRGDDGMLTLYYASKGSNPVVYRYQITSTPPTTQELFNNTMGSTISNGLSGQPITTNIPTGTSPQIVKGVKSNYLMVCMVPGYPELIPMSTVNESIQTATTSS